MNGSVAPLILNFSIKQRWVINPFSGGFIIASHIYKGEFPLPPAGI
jgi:hypothetical protein